MLEASDLVREGTTDLSTPSFSTLAGKTAPAPLSSIAKHAEGTVLEDDEVSQDLQDASEGNDGSSASNNAASEDNTHGDERKREESVPKKEDAM